MDKERLMHEQEKSEKKKKVKLNSLSYDKQISRQTRLKKLRMTKSNSKEKL